MTGLRGKSAHTSEIDDLAAHLIAAKDGIGMRAPFFAETASAKGDLDWPFWIVRNKTCNSLGALMPQEIAEALASAMNRAAKATEGQP
jgi:hypothetical protein